MSATLHAIECTAAIREVGVVALLDDATALEHVDHIAVANGVEAVGNGYCGAMGHDLVEAVLHDTLVL